MFVSEQSIMTHACIIFFVSTPLTGPYLNITPHLPSGKVNDGAAFNILYFSFCLAMNILY